MEERQGATKFSMNERSSGEEAENVWGHAQELLEMKRAAKTGRIPSVFVFDEQRDKDMSGLNLQNHVARSGQVVSAPHFGLGGMLGDSPAARRLAGLPERLLRWYATDCVARYYGKFNIYVRRRMVPKLITDSIEWTRRRVAWVGEANAFVEEEGIPPWGQPGAASAARVKETFAFMQPLRHPNHLDAALRAERMMGSTTFVSNPCSEVELSPHAEGSWDEVWSARRLRYLVDVWLTCGERAASLLLDGTCPLDWKDWSDLPVIAKTSDAASQP